MLQNTVSGVDNDTRRIEKVYFGPSSGLDASTAGTEYSDAFESRRLTYIGPVSNGSLVTTTINYTYDPLYRLTNANYSGAYTYTFAYAYDAVGNRTAQTRTITSTQVITYVYDNANRMTKAGGVTYTWDNNGNLTNDGSSLYRYDQANRLISTTLSGATSLFNYNGDGVRLKQIVAGTPITYTQDYAAPLPVVLQARTGTTTTKYQYSLGTRPLAQNTTAWEYLLPDALGSVRQIADANSNVTSAKSYEPYGSVLNNSGSASSIFGFSGEQADNQTGLLFLRARYMQPNLGVFLSRDPWSGDVMRPGSMNGFGYGEGNPISHVDPSGMQENVLDCRLNTQACEALLAAVAVHAAEIVSSVTVGPYVLVGVLVVGGPLVLMLMAPPFPKVYPPPVPVPTPKTIPTMPPVGPIPTLPGPQDIARNGGWRGPAPAPNPQPTPEPNPEPRRGPADPAPWITCTPTEEPHRKHIALGVADHIFGFWNGLKQKLNPQNIDVYTFSDWKDVGLSDVEASMTFGTFGLAFKQATSRAERIHFNLEGIEGDPNEFAENLGGQGQFDVRGIKVTAAELYIIKHRSELCAKTDFYETGSTNLTPSIPWWDAICK